MENFSLSLEEYKDLCENATDLIQSVTTNGHFKYVNNTWLRVLGYTRREVVKMTIFDIIHSDEIEHCQRLFKSVMSGDDVGLITTIFVTKNGQNIIVEGNVSCNFIDSKPVHTRAMFRDITKRKQVEQALEEKENKYSNLTASLNEVIYRSDPETFIATYVNKSIENLYGYTVEEWLKDPTLWENAILPEGKEKVFAGLARANVKKQPYIHVYQIIRKDKSVRWVRDHVSWEKDEQGDPVSVNGVMYNITERKRTEQNIAERIKELTCLYEISQLINKADISLEEILKGTVEIIPDAWQYPEITCARMTFDGTEFKTDNFAVTEWEQSSDIELKGKRVGTLEVYYLQEKVEIDEGPFLKEERNLIDAIAERLGRVIERMRAEENLSRLNLELEERVKERTKQLEQALQVVEVASQAKSDFLGSMSHELRTPLNAVIGFSQVLQEQYFGKLNEKQVEYVTDILESGQHLLSIVSDILDFSEIGTGKIKLELSKVIIKDLLENSLIMIKRKVLVHGISLDIDTTGDLEGLEIKADERRVKQVMFNLLSNAVKFTPDGGAIKIEGKKEGKELIISVSDTGVGIAPEEQEKIFREFYQTSGGITDKTPGTGLGLPLTKSIVEMHGGRIWMESEGSGKGSRFTFTLPIG